MLGEGFIDRAPDPDDGRQARLTINNKGRQMQLRIEAILAAREEEVFGTLDASEQSVLETLLAKLVRHAATLDR